MGVSVTRKSNIHSLSLPNMHRKLHLVFISTRWFSRPFFGGRLFWRVQQLHEFRSSNLGWRKIFGRVLGNGVAISCLFPFSCSHYLLEKIHPARRCIMARLYTFPLGMCIFSDSPLQNSLFFPKPLEYFGWCHSVAAFLSYLVDGAGVEKPEEAQSASSATILPSILAPRDKATGFSRGW